MVVDSVIFTRLKAEVTELDGRIYPQRAPANAAYPYIAFNKLSDSRERLLDGSYESIARAEFDLFVWSDDYLALQELTGTVIDTLNTTVAPIAGIDIQMIDATTKDSELDEITEGVVSTIAVVIIYST